MTDWWNKRKQQTEHMRLARRGLDIPALLFDLLKHATPHKHESKIIALLPFKDEGIIDEHGNFIIRIGEKQTTMFSSHMDTVHGQYSIIHPVMMGAKGPDQDKGMIWACGLGKNKKDEINYYPAVLGADDKIGIYTMCKLIENKVPGLYVFHVGEECGGIGSRAIVDKNPKLVEGIERCIAFDRRGYTDIIAFQRGERCASAKFTDALAEALNEKIGLPKSKYKGDITGVFTDTANYRGLIPECTNISIGYDHEHTTNEQLDWFWYSTHFLPAALQVKWDELPTVRDPKVVESKYASSSYSYGHTYNYGAKVKAEDVTATTPYNRIPDWDPREGINMKCSSDGMIEIIKKWMNGNSSKAASIMFDLMLMNEMQEEEIKKLTNGDENVDPTEDTVEDEVIQTGMPLDQKTIDEQVDYKIELIEGLLQYSISVGAGMEPKLKNQLGNSLRRFVNIKQRLKVNTVITLDDYTSLNQIILDVGGIYLLKPDKNPVNLNNWLRDCTAHITEFSHEPAFSDALKDEAA